MRFHRPHIFRMLFRYPLEFSIFFFGFFFGHYFRLLFQTAPSGCRIPIFSTTIMKLPRIPAIAMTVLAVLASGLAQERKYVTKTISTIDRVITRDPNVQRLQPLIDKGFDRHIKLPRFAYQTLDPGVVRSFIADASASDLSAASVAKSMDRTILASYRKAMLGRSRSVAEQAVTEIEKESSSVVKQKESAVTSSDILKAMNTGYIYIPVVTSFKEEVKEKTVSSEINGYMLWYHLETDATGSSRFVLVEEKPQIATGTGTGTLGTTYGLKRRTVEGREFARILAIDTWAKNLSLAMRRNPEFSLSGEVKEIRGSEVAATMGTREGIDLDEGFTLIDFYEKENGDVEPRTIGFFRAKNVANNDPAANGDPKRMSLFANYIGHGYERGMILTEHPQMGLDIDIRARFTKLNVPRVATIATIGSYANAFGPLSTHPDVAAFEAASSHAHPYLLSEDVTSAIGADLNFRYNLARLTNVRQLFLAVDLSGAFPMISTDESAVGAGSTVVPILLSGYVGPVKKLWFTRANLNIGIGVGVDWFHLSNSNPVYGEMETMSVASIGARAEVGLEYLVTPDFMINVSVAYKFGILPFNGTVKFNGISDELDLTKDNVLVDSPFYKDFSFSGASASFGISYSLPSLSSNPFSGLETSRMDY